VIDFYDAGGVRADSNPLTGEGGYLLEEVEHDGVAEETNRVLGLTQTEKDDLLLYLEALSAGLAGSSAGPSGWNGQPLVTLVHPTTPPPYPAYQQPVGTPGQPVPNLVFDVTDPLDGQADLDTTMSWTLEVVAGGSPYDWTSATTLRSIANGWRASFTIPGGVNTGDMVRAADHHGRWSDWVVLP
jgi:hypothetical protein